MKTLHVNVIPRSPIQLGFLLISLTLVCLGLSPTTRAVDLLPDASHSLFCPARYSDKVAVIDPLTDQVVTQIPVGTFPIRIVMTPNRRKAFVSNGDSAS